MSRVVPKREARYVQERALFLLKMNSPQTFNLRRVVEQIDADYARRVVQRCV